MFQLYLCLELLFTQTISFHYTLSLLHILKMMMNATSTLQPMAKYSTFLSLLFLTPLLLLFFSKIPLPLATFFYAHSSMLPFPLLFDVVFQLHFFHSYYYELQNFENAHNFQQKNTSCVRWLLRFFSSLNIPPVTFIFSYIRHLLIDT